MELFIEILRPWASGLTPAYDLGAKLTSRKSRPDLYRRQFLRSSSLLAGGAILTGFDKILTCAPAAALQSDPLEAGEHLSNLDFVGESRAPLDTLFGSELDGRLYSDLSLLTRENPLPPTEKFYIRNNGQIPEPAKDGDAWEIVVEGEVEVQAVSDQVADDRNNIQPRIGGVRGLPLPSAAYSHCRS